MPPVKKMRKKTESCPFDSHLLYIMSNNTWKWQHLRLKGGT